MRFIVVHVDQKSAVVKLIDELNADDQVRVVLYKGEKVLTEATHATIFALPAPEIALIGVRKEYAKAIAKQCITTGGAVLFARSSITVAEAEVRQWLGPPPDPQAFLETRLAFEQAISREPRLLLAEGAMDRCDELDAIRLDFTNKSASALAQYAGTPNLATGRLKDFFADNPHKLQFAPNGPITVKYKGYRDGRVLMSSSTQWHLRKGEYTERRRAARIYFDRIEVGEETKVVVLYCGPHPEDDFEAAIIL